MYTQVLETDIFVLPTSKGYDDVDKCVSMEYTCTWIKIKAYIYRINERGEELRLYCCCYYKVFSSGLYVVAVFCEKGF